MIEVKNDALVFSFPDVHRDARCSVIFQRTLRVPEDCAAYPVPPGMGRFPLLRVEDYADLLPESWEKEGGALLPMYQAEALWVIFVGWYPCAIKVTADGVNAITGKRVFDERLWRPQDYIVVPQKPWMEWFCVGGDRARQFTALPLETGASQTGGSHLLDKGTIRVTIHPMEGEQYSEYRKKRIPFLAERNPERMATPVVRRRDASTGRIETGTARNTLSMMKGESFSIHTVNSLSYRSITGRRPPGTPPSPREYSAAGLPWFECYGSDAAVLQ